ncbi:MAG TPA: HAD family hydrolase [Gemmata sp.]|jgi:phosphoglycolate phosphatase-like HAD superfamily hydrolase|nr:HAD family hydrolase [Gemmata sp.]
MIASKSRLLSILASFSFLAVSAFGQSEKTDPLPSWNEGPAKKAILDFVRSATDKGSLQYVPPEQRIATFDQDGTLWVEQPIYTQVTFALDRVKALAPKHPEWKDKEPFKAILIGDKETIAKFTIQELEGIIAETHTGMTVDEFNAIVKDWLATAKHPRFKRPYTECIYQPMLEVMKHLRASGFKTYIVSGGGQEFIRVYAEAVYGVPPEQVIGSAGQTKFEIRDGKSVLVKLPKLLLLDDHGGKPEGINLVIGRRPVAAFGNSDGDREMLEYTQGGGNGRLMMLVHHDDAKREYAYGPKSKIGTFSDELMAEAKKRNWTVISMLNDWKRVFSFEK